MVVCHNVTRAIAVPSVDNSQNISEFESNRALKSAEHLNIPSVSKCWQLLLKGHSEIQSTYSVKEATEMILLRITYAANLPDLKSLIEKSNFKKKKLLNNKIIDDSSLFLKKEISSEATINHHSEENILDTFENLLKLVKNSKELSLYTILIDQIQVIDYKPYYIKLSFVLKNYNDILEKIKKSLLLLTKKNWSIEVIEKNNSYKSITEKLENENEEIKNEIQNNILVKSIIDEFPDSKIIEIKKQS
jgi:DNA polymerase-3 subunit gamma/tau